MSQARLEATIASAHRVVWAAAAQAERRSDQAVADDLHQIADELRRVGESLLRPGQYQRLLADVEWARDGQTHFRWWRNPSRTPDQTR